jgi:hypothetical protein
MWHRRSSRVSWPQLLCVRVRACAVMRPFSRANLSESLQPWQRIDHRTSASAREWERAWATEWESEWERAWATEWAMESEPASG